MRKCWHGRDACRAWYARSMVKLLLLLLSLLRDQGRSIVVGCGEVMGRFHLTESASAPWRIEGRLARKTALFGGRARHCLGVVIIP